jgi:PAS domain S-box-containing protein
MSEKTQAIVFNAVPLLVLAALYIAVTAALVPAARRGRGRATAVELALWLLFPCIGIAAAILGMSVLLEQKPIGGHVSPPFAAALIALIPALLFFARWRERAFVVTGARRAREAEEQVSFRDRELEALSLISNALARTTDTESVARVLLDQVGELFGVGFAALALVDVEGREARGLVARGEGADVEWWRSMRLDLQREPSGIASAVFEAAPLAVYDVKSSSIINQRIADKVRARSAAFVPLVTEERVIGVLIAATTDERRDFAGDELNFMQSLAAEAALALDRMRSAAALGEALDRERLVAEISRRVRSELDLGELLRVAVKQVGEAMGAARCFIRLSEPGGEMPVEAEWRLQRLDPIGSHAPRLPVSNLAARERRSVAIGDVRSAPELEDPSLGGVETLLELGSLAVLACPLIVFDRMIGVLAFHRTEAISWEEAEIALAEAVAREVGLAIHTAGLLAENKRRLEQQAALLDAAQVVTSELRLEAVLQRLVDQVALLLEADAADCYLYEAERGVLRCAAVHALPRSLVGFEFPSGRGLAGAAIAEGSPVLSEDYARIADPVPHEAYDKFTGAIVAPVMWSDEIHGVLGVGAREGRRSFTDADADLLGAFASLASLALRNAETFEERSRQAQIQRGFFRIATVLGEPLSLEQTLEAVAQAAGDALGADSAAVLMPQGEALTTTAAYELPPALAKLLDAGVDDSSGPLPGAARNGRVLAAPKVEDDERFAGDWRRLAADGAFASLLAIPVAAADTDENGLVVVFFADEKGFTDDDLELGRHLAGAARGALERSRLYETERSSRALSQQLARTGSLLAAQLEPAAVVEVVAQRAPDLLDADASSIQLLEGEELVIAAAMGESEDDIGARAPAASWVGGDVVQGSAPLAIRDAAEEMLVRTDPVLSRGYHAYLGAPLIGAEGTFQGVLAVYCREPRAWREEEVAALGALAANTSAALSNAELYQRVALEKERSFAILANVADGIVAVDREGLVVLWNRAAEQITGVPAEEALGRPTSQVLQRSLESEGERPVGNRLLSIRRGNEEVWLSVTEAVMHDPAGAVSGRIFAFRDISGERAVEQMKSDFVSTVSHELRTPLTSIYGFAETLLRRDVLFGEQERDTFLGYIASESARLTEIVDALLNVARLETGDLQVEVAPTDVRAIVSEVVSSVDGGAVDGHRFVVELPDEPLDAEADRDKLRQILVNLVDNAVKYSPGGGTVTVTARQEGDAVEIRVVDEGIGIPAAEQQRIFSKFYRAEAAARDAGSTSGTGLGLFIAQGLVEAMGGRIFVDSTEGEGSSFILELPAARERAGAGMN